MSSKFRPALFLLPLIAACSQEPAADSESADDFASRVNGTAPAAQAPAGSQQPMTVPSTAEGKVADAPSEPGATGLVLPVGAASCNAPAAQAFLDRQDSPDTQAALTNAVGQGVKVRFLPPGSSDKVGAMEDRLNVMIDTTGTIRDLRCG